MALPFVKEPSVEELERSTVSDARLKRSIWGPFYYFAQLTGLVLYISPEDVKTKRALLHLIPNVFITLILLSNSVYTVVRMNGNTFSINWCYSISLMFFAIHGTVCSVTMLGYKFKNYFSNVIALLRKATRNNVSWFIIFTIT